MSCTNCLFVSGSITLTAAVIVVGIGFFAPYWLSNLAAAAGDELKYTDPQGRTYLSIGNVSALPDRGLWAQCGAECQWFWEYDYELQQRVLTPLSQSFGCLLMTSLCRLTSAKRNMLSSRLTIAQTAVDEDEFL